MPYEFNDSDCASSIKPDGRGGGSRRPSLSKSDVFKRHPGALTELPTLSLGHRFP